MSNPPGIDLDHLFSRLHTGMLGLQSWRDHRRARQADAAPTAAASPTVAAPHPTAASPGPLEPQGIVDIGGRLYAVLGDLRTSPSAPPSTTESPTPPPTPPAVPPTAEPTRPTRLQAAVLKMPEPTPPACLGRPSTLPADDAAPRTEPTASTPNAPPGTPMSAMTLETVLQKHREAEATRLEQVHAEHRALLATLLGEHRAQLAAQAEAAAQREDQRVRTLLAEHRAQLAAHAEALHRQQADHHEEGHALVNRADQATEAHARSITDLQALLAEQVKLQAHAHEQTEQHIGDLAGVLGDLGQTVGQLAAATFERKRAPTFLPPPQLGGSVATMPSPPSPPIPTAQAAPSSTPTAHRAPPPASLDAPGPPPTPAPRPEAAQTRVAALLDEFDDADLDTIDDPDDPPPRGRLSPITPIDRLEPPESAHG